MTTDHRDEHADRLRQLSERVEELPPRSPQSTDLSGLLTTFFEWLDHEFDVMDYVNQHDDDPHEYSEVSARFIEFMGGEEELAKKFRVRKLDGEKSFSATAWGSNPHNATARAFVQAEQYARAAGYSKVIKRAVKVSTRQFSPQHKQEMCRVEVEIVGGK